jgi:hypothetical protein
MAKRKQRPPVAFTVRVPAELLEKVDNICRIEGKSRNDAVAVSLVEYVQAHGDFIESHLHFKMSLAYQLTLHLGRLERLLRIYLAAIMCLLIVLVRRFAGDKGVEEALLAIEDIDGHFYPIFRNKARRIEPPEPEDFGPPKLRIPKE